MDFLYDIFFLGLRTANENMEKLMGRLETLSVAIGQLNPASSEKSSPASGGGVSSGTTGSGHSNGLKMSSSLDSQNIDRWHIENSPEKNDNSSTKVKRKMLVRQKKSVGIDDEIIET